MLYCYSGDKMNVMMIGDVVSDCGRAFLSKHLPALKKLHGIDICVVNGENSAKGNGITPDSADELFSAGDIQSLFGEKLCSLFAAADFRITT